MEDKKRVVDREREFRNSNVGKAIFDESGDCALMNKGQVSLFDPQGRGQYCTCCKIDSIGPQHQAW